MVRIALRLEITNAFYVLSSSKHKVEMRKINHQFIYQWEKIYNLPNIFDSRLACHASTEHLITKGGM